MAGVKGKSGRKRLPLGVKQMRDSRIRPGDLAPSLASMPLACIPDPPEYLGEAGKQFWKQQGPYALSVGIVEQGDLFAFAALADSWDYYQRLAKEAQGAVEYEDRKGVTHVRAIWKELRIARAELIGHLTKMAMAGPHSRRGTGPLALPEPVDDPEEQAVAALQQEYGDL